MKFRTRPGFINIAFIIMLTLLMLPSAWGATLVVANKAEATASLINLETGEVVATLPTGDGPHEVGISPNGKQALVTNYRGDKGVGNTLTLIDITTASVVKTIDLGEYKAPHGVEWIDDSQAAVTVEDNQALVVVDVPKGEVVKAIGTNQRASHMVALGSNNQVAYVANIGSGSVSVLHLESGELVANVPTGDGAEGVAVSASGHIWVTNRAADTVVVLNGSDFSRLKEITSPGFPIRATATPKGQVLVSRARGGDLAIYDAENFDEQRTVSFDIDSLGAQGRLFGDRFGDSSVPIGVITDSEGNRAFVAHANADVITEIDLSSGEIVRLLRAGQEPDGMGYSPLAPGK